jgi:large repetitive protein
MGPALRAAAAALVLLSAFAPAASAQDTRHKQEILFPELPARTVGDAPFVVTARATSGLPVTFEIVSGPAVLEGKTLKLTNASGLVIIRASQSGNDAFLPAAAAERAFTVNGRPSPPTIISQPAGTHAGAGEIIMLSVGASGEPKPAFQWRKDGSPISGATDSRFTVTSASEADAGSYDVVVSNSLGSVTSERANVSIGKRSQTITFQGAMNAVVGQAVMLTANASSGLAVRFDVVSGVAVLNGATLTATQAGTVVIQASQAGDSTYDAASPVTQTFLVSGGLNGQHFP